MEKAGLNGAPHVKTCDLYYGAYLLSSGSKLEAVQVHLDGSKKVYFEFSSPRIQSLAQEYTSGGAVVNVRNLKSSLQHLKDLIYQKIAR